MSAQDARQRTITYFETYYTPANAVDDNSVALGEQFMYEGPDYPLEREFKAPSVVDVIVTVGQPNTTALPSTDHSAYGYDEQLPIKIFSVNKTDVTAVKAIWEVERELRRIQEANPGTIRRFTRLSPAKQVLGSTTLYGAEYIMVFRRDTTT